MTVKKRRMYKQQHISLSEELANSVRKPFSMFSVRRELESYLPLVQDLWGLYGYKRSNELNSPGFAAVPLQAKRHLTGVKSPGSDPDTWHNWKPRDTFMMCWSTIVVTIWKWKAAGHHNVVCCTLALKHILLNCILKSLICTANKEAVRG